MTGYATAFRASFALVLLSGLVAGCASTRPHEAEIIPAQVCGGNIDSDGDGVIECNDHCPGTLRGEAVDPDGCPLPPMLPPKPYRG